MRSCSSAAAGACSESLDIVQSRGIPVVVIEGDAGPGIPQIRLDNREAQRQAASHLRSLGHENVGIVALPARREPRARAGDG